MRKPPTKLKKVRIKLPFVDTEWEADEAEQRVLRDLVDQIRTRRAFELNRCSAAEQPDYFLASIVEARASVREILGHLPVTAVASRLLLLEVQNLLAEVLDEWHRSAAGFGRGLLPFEDLPFPARHRVMEGSWAKIEEVRRRLDEIATGIEGMLEL